MDYRLFKTEDQGTEEQSWGRSREIAIFPYDKVVEERDFLWRITRTVVDEEEAELDQFEGYDRVLTVLEGDVVLAHEGERVARMKEKEQDSFDGSKRTKSFGKIIGYDLILRKGNQGILEWVKAETNSKVLEPSDFLQYESRMWCFYCVNGYGVLHDGQKSKMIRQEELLVLDFREEEPGRLTIMGEGDLIWTQIYCASVDGPEEIPREKGTFRDFLICVKLANSNFRGGRRVFKSLRNIWYDEALQKGIRRVERFYISFAVGLLGLSVLALGAWELGGKTAVLPAILIWMLLHAFLVAPLIYFLSVPKPVRPHMKDIGSLTPYERKIYQRQKTENARLERLLKKYAITGRNKYID